MLEQAFDILGLDDNLTLPVLFGFGCWAVMWRTFILFRIPMSGG